MKKQVLVLLGSALILSACSESSDKTPKINPMAKPGNPASQAYISEVVSAIQNSNAYLPSEDAVFDSSTSSEKQEALGKLNTTGRQFVDKVKAICKLTQPQTFKSGTPASGATVVEKNSYSALGSNCPYEMEGSSVTSTYYNKIESDGYNISGKATISMGSKYRRTVRDERIKSASNIAEVNMNLEVNLFGDMAGTIYEARGTANGNITGNVKVQFANGETIQGPVEGIITVRSEKGTSKTDFSAIFKGTSPKGDIWLGIQTKDSKAELYLNGEKIDINSNGGVDKVFGAASKLIAIQ